MKLLTASLNCYHINSEIISTSEDNIKERCVVGLS